MRPRLVQKKGPVLLSTSQAQPGKTFSQLSNLFFVRFCTMKFKFVKMRLLQYAGDGGQVMSRVTKFSPVTSTVIIKSSPVKHFHQWTQWRYLILSSFSPFVTGDTSEMGSPVTGSITNRWNEPISPVTESSPVRFTMQQSLIYCGWQKPLIDPRILPSFRGVLAGGAEDVSELVSADAAGVVLVIEVEGVDEEAHALAVGGRMTHLQLPHHLTQDMIRMFLV